MMRSIVFDTKAGDTVLIDGPETSLHLSWQTQFVDDIMRIKQVKDLNVIIATHSPEIVGDYKENCVNLDNISKRIKKS